jgi:probable F420-dependent oxidoreductase
MALTSVSVTIFALDHFFGRDFRAVVDVAAAAEDAGVDHLALPDHVVMGERTDRYPFGTFPYPPQEPWLEPMVTLGAMAARTERLRLGCSVLVAGARPAALIAKSAATLDVLSDGRFDLGLGPGWQREEIEACGMPFENGRDRLVDTARACRTLWRDAPASFASATVSFSDIWCEPRPTSPDGVPIWFGIPPSERNATLIAELGAGWLPLGKDWTVDDTARGAARIRAAFEAAGRNPAELGVRAVLPPVLDADGRGLLAPTLEEGLPRLAAAGATSASLGLRFFAADAAGIAPFFQDLGRRWDAMGRSVEG